MVLDLLRGNLEGEDILRAETALVECSRCADWLGEVTASDAFHRVDDAVARSLRAVELPRRNRRLRWVAVAAAAVMTVGIGLWQLPRPQHSVTVTQPVPETQRIATFDFEAGSATTPSRIVAVEEPEQRDEKPLFSDGLEDGSPGSWEIHT